MGGPSEETATGEMFVVDDGWRAREGNSRGRPACHRGASPSLCLGGMVLPKVPANRGGYVSPAPRKVASTPWSPGAGVVQVRADVSAGTKELGVAGGGDYGWTEVLERG